MNSIEKKVPQKILEFLREEDISSDSTVVVGLSGGPDSTALLLSLLEIRNSLKLHIKAAYVNHGIRDPKELKEEDHFIKNLTERCDVPLFQLHISPGEIESITSSGRSPEEVARTFRYDFFNEILDKFKNSYLLLGHNRDDQYETIISRFFQGSSINGLKGIPHRNKQILRPLIQCRKSEILHYLSEINQNYLIDPSNNENMYHRNVIRNKLIPLIEEIFPGYAKALSIQEKRFINLEKLIGNETEQLNCLYQKDACSVSIQSYNMANEQVRLNLLYNMFDHCYRGDIEGFRLPAGFFNSLAEGDIQIERTYAQAYGIRIFTDKIKLQFSVINQEFSGYYYRLKSGENIIADNFLIDINENQTIKIKIVNDSSLFVRSRNDGDFIEVDGRKINLKKLFIKWNVKNEDKNVIPIFIDSDGIIAILGEFLGYKNIFRNKKINFDEKFNILYLGVSKILQE